MGNHNKLLHLFSRPDTAAVAAANSSESDDDDDYSPPTSPASTTPTTSAAASPYAMSPWTQLPGLLGADAAQRDDRTATGLLGSLVKEDGHVYSLAEAGDLLYTGTDSRNVRVWRDRREVLGMNPRIQGPKT